MDLNPTQPTPKADKQMTRRRPTTNPLPGSPAYARMIAAKRGPQLARATRGDRGPCPAVCLATLKAIPYETAKAMLHREHGFTGNGLYRQQCVAMMRQHFGPCTVREPSGSNVATAVRVFFAGGKSGAVCDRGHIMPVVRGRLMNAHFKGHAIRQIETVIVIDDDSEVKARA